MQENKHIDLGMLIADLAYKRRIKGPYLLAQYVRKHNNGQGPTGAAMSAIYRGINRPSPELLRLLDHALKFGPEETETLSRVYMFGESYEG